MYALQVAPEILILFLFVCVLRTMPGWAAADNSNCYKFDLIMLFYLWLSA